MEAFALDYGIRRKKQIFYYKICYLVLQNGTEEKYGLLFMILCPISNEEAFIQMCIWLMPADLRVLLSD
jgi:hypothetical protein